MIAVKDITLTEDDKREIIDGKILQDQYINFAQRLINQQIHENKWASTVSHAKQAIQRSYKECSTNHSCQGKPLGCGSIS